MVTSSAARSLSGSKKVIGECLQILLQQMSALISLSVPQLNELAKANSSSGPPDVDKPTKLLGFLKKLVELHKGNKSWFPGLYLICLLMMSLYRLFKAKAKP